MAGCCWVRLLLIGALAAFAGCATVQDQPVTAVDDTIKPPSPLRAPPPPPPAPKPEAKPPPKSTPKPEAKPKSAKPELQNVERAIDAFFDSGQALLRSDSRIALDAFLEAVSGVQLGTVVVTGHADRSEKSPDRLSEARASEVKQYLVLKGIDSKLIFLEGKGAKRPLATNNTPRERAKNRRVEVGIVGTTIGPAPEVVAKDPRAHIIPVLFATNRKKTGSVDPENYFGDQPVDVDAGESVTIGRAVVRVPPSHTQGRMEQPSWVSVTVQRVTSSAVFKEIGVQPYQAADPLRHFTFERPIQEFRNETEFKYELKKSLLTANSRAAVLYVHGYANDFKYAAFRAAQLAFDLRLERYEVVPLMFSWPSDVSNFVGFSNYTAAKDRSRRAGWHLADFLNKVTEASGVNVVHIVTHSMGAEVLGVALTKLGVTNLVAQDAAGRRAPKFNQIILAAPDVLAGDFREVILPAIESGHRVTNYASSNDVALRLSKGKNAGSRAGDSGRDLKLFEGIETIDASAVNSELLGHAFFAESPKVIRDLSQLMRTGAKPAARGLAPKPKDKRTYWVITP